MFCKNCGKELPAESASCPYCLTKFAEEKVIESQTPQKKKFNKKLLIAIVAVVCVIAIIVVAIVLPGSDDSNGDNGQAGGVFENVFSDGNSSKPGRPKKVDKGDNLGLMNVKLRGEGANLTDTQKLLVTYFDSDYFEAPYNSLQRYPQVYKGAQISFLCYVKKIIESNDKEYTLLVEYGAFETLDGFSESTGNYAVIKGAQSDTRIMEGDSVYIYGKYENINSYIVDGISYTVPTVLVNRYIYFSYLDWSEAMFSMEEIRTLAKYIFGDEVKIRYSTNEDDPSGDFEYENFEGNYYTAELDNQSNANFTKYVFFAGLGGSITDCKSEWPVERELTFSADFEHFYLQVLDYSLNTYTLECYDRSLKKIWSREFDQTTNAVLDYTADHIYLVDNGKMYIIDSKTGEDAVEPKFVGEKLGIRKLKDGILLIASGRSDAIMKTDLVGNVLWTVNLSAEISKGAECPIAQIIDGNYVVQYDGVIYDGDYPYSSVYSTVITPDGEVLFDGIAF